MPKTISVKRNSKQPTRVSLKGDVGIVSVSELHTVLKELADANVSVRVDCKDATHLDGSVCQLLLVAQRSWPGGADCFQVSNASPALESHLLRTGAVGVAST
ncbi:STAS domain-containing protein [Aeoliella sp.]|uniref:STAS domain-containing protein n=1 Tax=Aeoliella sp. TaxID=2795800 RepID=UPI003CCC4065